MVAQWVARKAVHLAERKVAEMAVRSVACLVETTVGPKAAPLERHSVAGWAVPTAAPSAAWMAATMAASWAD